MNSKKIIIDTANEEETRIAVVNNNELEEYDFEVSNKEEVKGNIYLAKVTRVESSLQAVFVEYGRNRQGFLPFNEISVNYFNLPAETKEKLKKEYQDIKIKKKKNKENQYNNSSKQIEQSDSSIDAPDTIVAPAAEIINHTPKKENDISNDVNSSNYLEENLNRLIHPTGNEYFMNLTKNATNNKKDSAIEVSESNSVGNTNITSPTNSMTDESTIKAIDTASVVKPQITESVALPEQDDTKEDKLSREYLEYGTRFGYKIQEVISKNQLILVQVVKDERGNKGASLTTYLSIPGRYCVFMPNSFNVEGGISKKIVDPKERTRLKNIINNLDIKENSTLIIRTAGVNKTEEEIKQDYQYSLNLWESIKNKYETSEEPTLIYEEASLIKKVLRDYQFDEVYVNNKNTFHSMVEFVKLISPEMIKKIKLFQGKRETIYNHFGIEEQVKSIYSPIVFLKSGGYLVIHPTEALTAIDINSGKFKGNKNVEETALKNNLEAAKEIAKQLKLRNLGGLIVIDFIDMENSKNRASVEKKLKDELRNDKAKIQVGQISSFGLLEMARQHVKSSLFEKNFIICPKCQGMGYLKPVELNALQILRDIKNDISLMTSISGKNFKIKLPSSEAFFILNNKRYALNSLEEYFDINIIIECEDTLRYPFYELKEINNNENIKNKNQTVLLLETEIANNLKIIKNKEKPQKSKINTNNNFNKNYSHAHNNNGKHGKNENYQYRKKNHNYNKNNKNNLHKQSSNPAKKSWIQRLLKI